MHIHTRSTRLFQASTEHAGGSTQIENDAETMMYSEIDMVNSHGTGYGEREAITPYNEETVIGRCVVCVYVCMYGLRGARSNNTV